MNSEPNVQDLPSRAEVIKLLAREKHRIAAVYDEQGEQVHLGGRQVPEAPVKADTSRVARCAICDAPSGQVTLMRVDEHSELAAKLRDELGLTGVYVCHGGNCLKQQHNALNRLINGKGFRITPTRLTASGRAMQWNQKGEFSYELTSRDVQRRKTVRGIQKASRRANRAK